MRQSTNAKRDESWVRNTAYKYWEDYGPSGSYAYDTEAICKKLLLIDPVEVLPSVITVEISVSQRKTQVRAKFHI